MELPPPDPTPAFRKVMIFIDGGYLRKGFQATLGSDRIKFTDLANLLISFVRRGHIEGELVSVFYYDAIVDATENLNEHKIQNKYFEEIRKCDFYEVKLARLKTSESGYKQKGVDVQLAIDMVTKAYQGQYDIAILVSGDDDLIDAVKAVKEAGKIVYGCYFEQNASKGLVNSFNARRVLTPKFLDSLVVKI